MVMSQHSSVPWNCEYAPYTLSGSDSGIPEELPNYRLYSSDGVCIGQTDEDMPGDVQQANACLMASAPDLLESLLDIKHIVGKSEDCDIEPYTLLDLVSDRVREGLYSMGTKGD